MVEKIFKDENLEVKVALIQSFDMLQFDNPNI